MGRNMLKHHNVVAVVAVVAVVVVAIIVLVFLFVATTAAAESISVHINHGCTNFLKI